MSEVKKAIELFCALCKKGDDGEIPMTGDKRGTLVGETQDGLCTMYLCANKDEWLRKRKELGTIGASDAPTIEGITDAWRTAKDLFDEMTGKKASSPDLSDNELVRLGNLEEPLVRELFAIENAARFEVYDGTNLIFHSKVYPFAHASLDAVLWDKQTGEWADLEIKCAPWSRKWQGCYIPDNYFVQLLWQIGVTGFRSAYLRGRMRRRDERRMVEEIAEGFDRTYFIDRRNMDVESQVKPLFNDGERFYRMVKDNNFFPMGIRV